MGYTEQQMRDAAKIPPSKRTVAQQAAVSAGRDIQAVRNIDYESKRADRGR